ncbi:MAG: hypothetical protein HY900_14535 [Deltaproteobacteria bacterium]|nr:hypothetical protein [Deltaproteobacteria bacterium]
MRKVAALAALLLAGACAKAPSGPLVISVSYLVNSLDPHAWNYLGDFSIASHFYEPLVTNDAEMRLQPCLARSWENPDPHTWVLHLQPGVTFHSGRPLRARDVVFTIRRLQTEQGLEMTGWIAYVSEVAALDDLTVRIRTQRPFAVLLNKLRFVAIVPEGASAATLAQQPDGTGPYTFAGWTKGVSIRMARNPRYRAQPPPIDAVTFRLGREPEQAAADLQSGQSQLVQCDSKKVAARLERSGFAVRRRTTLRLEYLGYDLHSARTPYASDRSNPFLDPLVRRALHLAFDRRRLVERLTTDAVAANQLVPPFVFGFNPSLPETACDPEEARRLLRKAGRSEGFRVTLHARSRFQETAEELREQLRPLGIQVEVRLLPQDEFLDMARRREVSLYVSRYGCLSGDASDVLDNGVHSPDAAGQMGLHNYGGYSNPELDRLIEESAGIEPAGLRRHALENLMARLMEDLPWLPLYFGQDVYVMDEALTWTPRCDSFVLAAEVARRRR